MGILALAGGAAREVLVFFAEETGEPGFQINLFWVVAQALSFLLFLAIIYLVAFRRISGTLETRRARIEQGLRDADQARHDREEAATERQRVLAEARREANDILSRAQKLADEARAREEAEVQADLERQRAQAAAEIAAERLRALSEVRGVVADLAIAAASRVLGESVDDQRERRLVDEFLTELEGAGGPITATQPGASA